MLAFTDVLLRLENNAGRKNIELSTNIVAYCLQCSASQASNWLECFGDPLEEWKSSFALAIAAGLNPEVVRATCVSQLETSPDESLGVASDMTRLILQALVVFRDETERNPKRH